MTDAAHGAIDNYQQARWARQQNTYNHMMSNPSAAAQGFDHRAQESFTVPAGNNRPAAAQQAAADDVNQMTQNFGTVMSLDQTRDDLGFSDTNLSAQLAGIDVPQMNRFSSHDNSVQSSEPTLSSTVVAADPNDERPIGGTGAARYHPAATNYDDRPINATGMYDLSAIPVDEIDLEDNYSEVELASKDSFVLNSVKQVYFDILNNATESFVQKKTIEVQEDLSRTQKKNEMSL